MSEFEVKDSGEREEFDSGMVRDTEAGKADFTYVIKGPMLERWAIHLQKGASKYARDNWMQAVSWVEHARFVRSAWRHMIAWTLGKRDEDHAAAIFFNVNGAEYVYEWLDAENEDKKFMDEVYRAATSGGPADPPATDEWKKYGLSARPRGPAEITE